MAGLLGVERTRLSELLGSLERADWDRPTPCPGWTVLGLCCHLPTTTAAAAGRTASLSRGGRRGTIPGVGLGPGEGPASGVHRSTVVVKASGEHTPRQLRVFGAV